MAIEFFFQLITYLDKLFLQSMEAHEKLFSV